ncbi:zinc ribbon domain-containing protein [Ruegeria sp. HKCCD7318]|uniref:zinc ribbon domain-containing protein n=1 Tax=Ruegeria sp. HKCCD7318 TaxID=2683014 RepID=UPI0014925734|nr:zinc ribbon domain-containing protein [Ruegeria sp. HKCCD7318]NOE32128.1 hypothetical protein [Ruegeria sp. HKCCD7318]
MTATENVGRRFHPDYGYGGKILVRDEPVATILAEALTGYASGRFQSQAEVKRFLDSKPEFPKDYRKTEVRFDSVTKYLKNLLYAGYLEKREWGVPFTKAQHESLISLDVYQQNQKLLRQSSVAPSRKDISPDFPLRGFIKCHACGHRITACWSKSHTGDRYPYYLCQYRGCPEKGKSSARDKVEEQFENLLKTLVPTEATYQLAEQMFIQRKV